MLGHRYLSGEIPQSFNETEDNEYNDIFLYEYRAAYDNYSIYNYNDVELSFGGAYFVEQCLLVTITVFGSFGNALVIYVVRHHRGAGKITYLYLCNLAFVNVVFLLTTLPITSVSQALRDWPFGSITCEYY